MHADVSLEQGYLYRNAYTKGNLTSCNRMNLTQVHLTLF